MKTAEPDYDVLIIGSGAGGGSAAWALTQAGMRVLLLEAGPRFDPQHDYRLDRADWELRSFPVKAGSRRRHTVAGMQALDPSYAHLRSWNKLHGASNTGDRRRPVGYSHVCGVGGSTLHFTGEAHRLHPRAMRMHSDFGVAADWPLDYAALEPWYEQAEDLIGVSGPAGDRQRPRRRGCPLPPHAPAYASARLIDAAQRVGVHFQPNHLVALSQPYDGRPGCNYCGQCRRGCPRDDKGSVDITFVRKAEATGRLTLRTGCAVIAIQGGDRDRIVGVVYRDAQDQEHHARAGRYLVCAGAVETPRLLLNSADSRSPDGLCNESGQVGRNFMETLFWGSSGLFPQRLDGWRGLPADVICWDYNAPDAIPDVIGGVRMSIGTLENDLAGPVNHARRVAGGWGRQHHQRMLQTFGRVITLNGIGEFLPNQDSYIDLDPREADTLGQPLARIHSHLDDMALRRLDFMAGKIRELLRAMGVEELVEEHGSYDLFNCSHVFGSCRMGSDPQRSVVTPGLRSHRWRNLYIMDASVFPSSGGGEAPSLTIQALTLRACAGIAANR